MKGSMTAQNSFLLDALHVFVGVAVTVLAVFAFLSPEEHPLFFSLIFGLAGLLALGRAHRKKGTAFAIIFLGLLLLMLCAISAVVML